MNIDSSQVKTEKVKEEVMVLNNTVYRDCSSCSHYFIQKTATTAECTKCGMGTFGHVKSGELTKDIVRE